jgi:hypothetical protein
MLRRVVLGMGWTVVLALACDLPANATWFDSATGQPVHVTPRGNNQALSNQAVFGGRDVYWDPACSTWRDSANGKEVHVTPRGNNQALSNQAVFGGHDVYWQPCPPPPTAGGIEVSASLGVSHTSTSVINLSDFSAGVQDANTQDRAHASGTGFVGGVGASATLGSFASPFGQLTPHPMTVSRYAPEAKNAYAAYFPLKAPPQAPAPRWSWGIDGNVYFFAGGDGRITGIPGGPFGTATGIDTFRISNNVMFTAGGFITAPVAPNWSVSLTGGFAELNQTVKYNCVTFCAVAPATPAFTASQDRWVSGGYVGGRLAMPVAWLGLPGANIGLDYKHVFFGNYTASLGTVPTRQVNARLSPDMDLVTVRLGVPLR